MDSAYDSLSQKLSITSDNRHQYYETAIGGLRAESEIARAEQRGRERRAREQRRKQTLSRAAWGVLAVVVCGALAALLIR